MIRQAYLDAADVAARLLREPALAERWRRPSALPEMSIAALAYHLASQITLTVSYLAAPPGRAAIPLLRHYTDNDWVTSGLHGETNVAIREGSDRAAADTTPDALADEVDAAIATLRQVVPAQPADRIVDFRRWGLTVDDFLTTRVMELVVHSDDLAVSLDIPTPAMPVEATGATIALLAQVAAWRHGPLAVVRALARGERAPQRITAL
ncbi:MAG TPA: maleylpyruvate isomerase N-terminal domain-containing protein [Micromonosporaceae bacterium]